MTANSIYVVLRNDIIGTSGYRHMWKPFTKDKKQKGQMLINLWKHFGAVAVADSFVVMQLES